MRSWRVHMGSVVPKDQLILILLVLIQFRVNQGLYGFVGVIIGFIIQKNMGLETKILSLSIPDPK